jgi:hypothetical protein
MICSIIGIDQLKLRIRNAGLFKACYYIWRNLPTMACENLRQNKLGLLFVTTLQHE